MKKLVLGLSSCMLAMNAFADEYVYENFEYEPDESYLFQEESQQSYDSIPFRSQNKFAGNSGIFIQGSINVPVFTAVPTPITGSVGPAFAAGYQFNDNFNTRVGGAGEFYYDFVNKDSIINLDAYGRMHFGESKLKFILDGKAGLSLFIDNNKNVLAGPHLGIALGGSYFYNKHLYFDATIPLEVSYVLGNNGFSITSKGNLRTGINFGVGYKF